MNIETVPTADGHAAATIEILQHLNVSHTGLITSKSEYSKSFFGFFQKMASKAGITVVSGTFKQFDDEEGMVRACKIVQESGFRYIVTVGASSNMELLLGVAGDFGMTGPGFQWITTGMARSDIPELFVNQTSLIPAFNGLISAEIEIPTSNQFFGSLMGSMSDPEFTSFFVDSHPESFIWDNYAFNETPPVIARYAYTYYDAVMAVGISACETKVRSFTGLEHYDQLKRTTFTGASGDIEFDLTTGTRKIGNLKFSVTSLLIDEEKSTTETVVFSPQNPLTIDFALGDPVVVNSAITFSDNTTVAPQSLPPAGEVDPNLIPQGIRIFGWALAGALVVVSLGFAAYTFYKRKTAVIRASQPIFLGTSEKWKLATTVTPSYPY